MLVVWQDEPPCFQVLQAVRSFLHGGQRYANAVTSYGVDSNWYVDSGATDHVTGELHKLVVRDAYNSTNQIFTASVLGMRIKHIGQSIIHTPYRDL
jgi:hypothetical protein